MRKLDVTTEALDRDFARLVESVQVLASDVQAAAKLAETSDTQYARRSYVRAVFALYEGNINLMANVILRAADRQEVRLTPKEIEILRQERHTSDEAGLPVVRIKFVPICDRTAPVFEMFSRLIGSRFRLDRSSSAWVDFKTAVELRNRITHPKNAASFAIDDTELNAVERARKWFSESVRAMLTESEWRC